LISKIILEYTCQLGVYHKW